MDDLISRQALCEYALNQKDKSVIPNDIMRFPSARSEQRWIHVSERLPDDRQWYLGIFKEKDTGWVNPIPFICDYIGRKTPATTDDFWIIKEHSDQTEPGFDYYRNLECVAWSHCQSYEEEDDDESGSD